MCHFQLIGVSESKIASKEVWQTPTLKKEQLRAMILQKQVPNFCCPIYKANEWLNIN
jgi:hypothetical protein